MGVQRMRALGMNLRFAGLGMASILTMILGLVFIFGGLALGFVDGLVVGSMVALVVGMGTVIVAILLKEDH